MRTRLTKQQRRYLLAAVASVVIVALLSVVVLFLRSRHFALLDAQGPIASQQRDLMIFATVLSLVIILPVFVLTYLIVRNHRVRPDGTTRAKSRLYAPDLEGNRKLESLWWAIPSVIILVLSIVTWNTSHSLDPYRPITTASTKPVKVQVVAMQWKWLFIYPEQGIATVNYLKIPVGTPINFDITADAPMNSFWIPQLGGQVYAMTGMASQLHLQADKPGDYRGSSANLSGDGFAGMHFTAHAVSDTEFRNWAASYRNTSPGLDVASYVQLTAPSHDHPPTTYGIADRQLFQGILNKYMNHTETREDTTHDMGNQGMQHAGN